MKYILIILPVMLLAGCCSLFNPMTQDKYTPSTENPPMKICDSEECIAQNFETCTPAQFETAYSGTVILSEVRGVSSDGNCIAYIKLVKLNQSEVPEKFKLIASSIEGKDMVCAFSKEDVEKLVRKTFEKEMLTKCDGPLKGIFEIVAASHQP